MSKVTKARRPGPRWLGAPLMVALCAATTASVDDELPTRVGRVSEFAGAVYLAPQDRASGWAAIRQTVSVREIGWQA